MKRCSFFNQFEFVDVQITSDEFAQISFFVALWYPVGHSSCGRCQHISHPLLHVSLLRTMPISFSWNSYLNFFKKPPRIHLGNCLPAGSSITICHIWIQFISECTGAAVTYRGQWQDNVSVKQPDQSWKIIGSPDRGCSVPWAFNFAFPSISHVHFEQVEWKKNLSLFLFMSLAQLKKENVLFAIKKGQKRDRSKMLTRLCDFKASFLSLAICWEVCCEATLGCSQAWTTMPAETLPLVVSTSGQCPTQVIMCPWASLINSYTAKTIFGTISPFAWTERFCSTNVCTADRLTEQVLFEWHFVKFRVLLTKTDSFFKQRNHRTNVKLVNMPWNKTENCVSIWRIQPMIMWCQANELRHQRRVVIKSARQARQGRHLPRKTDQRGRQARRAVCLEALLGTEILSQKVLLKGLPVNYSSRHRKTGSLRCKTRSLIMAVRVVFPSRIALCSKVRLSARSRHKVSLSLNHLSQGIYS